jgi:hypothetical protein
MLFNKELSSGSVLHNELATSLQVRLLKLPFSAMSLVKMEPSGPTSKPGEDDSQFKIMVSCR